MTTRPGYSGSDAMREKAARLVKGESSGEGKMPAYKKGGTVKKTSEMRKAVKGRSKAAPPSPTMPGERMTKYAMGGVGKIRLKQSTKSGMPKSCK